MRGQVVEVTLARIGRETENALLVETQDGREIWLPFSTIDSITHGDPPRVTIARWLAAKEDLL